MTLDEESKFERKMKKVINENKYMLLLEHEIKSYSGENIQVEVNALPFSIDEHKNIMLIIKDLTHKKTSEMAEKELLDRLKTDKIKTEFFANMSHELKTPLNVISSSNQLVDSLYKNGKIEDYNDNMKSHIELVRQSAYRLQRLISNIIDLTKMESGFYNLKLANHNIVNVIEDLFSIVEQYASKKDISLVFDTDNEEININIDKVEIERIILNLLSSCIKFTNNGGSIFVNIYDGIDVVTISVKDNGVGIPKNKIDIIFEEFAQVDKTLSRNTEGSGIGLTIVKNLVELHQGDIKVNSKENIGTEFIITIPKTSLTKEDYKEDKRIYNIDEKVKIEFSDIYY
ncbi:sensor histidine kinase [Romboutsia lituseburensis]|uniref:sensor histidine kinase n=1 Tax=Romboutsia lituseburensis TaxID=1537 RepID=UPI000A9C29AE|nr:HAMP domain-containing sensor histidine kinase [Romboutsia lituseburensis]